MKQGWMGQYSQRWERLWIVLLVCGLLLGLMPGQSDAALVVTEDRNGNTVACDDTTPIPSNQVDVTETDANKTVTLCLLWDQLGDASVDVSADAMAPHPAQISHSTDGLTVSDRAYTPLSVTVIGDKIYEPKGAQSIVFDIEGNTTTISFMVTDNDEAALKVSDAHLVVTEGRSTSFTVALLSQPSGSVTVGIVNPDTSELTLSSATGSGSGTAATPHLLNFTASNWSSPQSITVRGVDDASSDGPQTVELALSVQTSADTDYDALPRPSHIVAVDVLDRYIDNDADDTALLSISPTALTITEGRYTSFSVELLSRPAGTVVVDVMSNDTTEAKVSSGTGNGTGTSDAPLQLRFTTDNWSDPQTVTVTGVNDGRSDGRQTLTITLDSADTGSGVRSSQTVDVTVEDRHSPLIETSVDSLDVVEGKSGTFQIRLVTQPLLNVNLTVVSSNVREITVEPPVLSFTANNYNLYQQVKVTAVDDLVMDGDMGVDINLVATSNDSTYNKQSAAVAAVAKDNDDTPAMHDDGNINGLSDIFELATVHVGGETITDAYHKRHLVGFLADSADAEINGGQIVILAGDVEQSSGPEVEITEKNPRTGLPIWSESEMEVQDKSYVLKDILQFRVKLPSGQDTVEMTIQYPNTMPMTSDMVVRKRVNGDTWQTVSGAWIDPADHTITFTLKDNGPFDLNPLVGVIDDPVALGTRESDATGTPDTDSSSSSTSNKNSDEEDGGCTLGGARSKGDVMLPLLLLAALGWVSRRRTCRVPVRIR
jgi:hypothetical protein